MIYRLICLNREALCSVSSLVCCLAAFYFSTDTCGLGLFLCCSSCSDGHDGALRAAEISYVHRHEHYRCHYVGYGRQPSNL